MTNCRYILFDSFCLGNEEMHMKRFQCPIFCMPGCQRSNLTSTFWFRGTRLIMAGDLVSDIYIYPPDLWLWLCDGFFVNSRHTLESSHALLKMSTVLTYKTCPYQDTFTCLLYNKQLHSAVWKFCCGIGCTWVIDRMILDVSFWSWDSV